MDASISGTGKPSVLLMDHMDPFLFFCIIFTDLRALIRRPIVHQNHLQVFISLGKNTFHTSFQILFYPVYRYNYTD